MKRALLTALMTYITATFMIAPANACTQPFREQGFGAELIFVGRAEKISPVRSEPDVYDVTFRMDYILNGRAQKTIVVRDIRDPDCWGRSIPGEGYYVVFAEKVGGRWVSLLYSTSLSDFGPDFDGSEYGYPARRVR